MSRRIQNSGNSPSGIAVWSISGFSWNLKSLSLWCSYRVKNQKGFIDTKSFKSIFTVRSAVVNRHDINSHGVFWTISTLESVPGLTTDTGSIRTRRRKYRLVWDIEFERDNWILSFVLRLTRSAIWISLSSHFRDRQD